jgi:ferric-dicitrate binding protein FerR (iron transport regulator)
MIKNNNIKSSKADFNKFIEYRKGLSAFDKKTEAAGLIEQIREVDVERAYYIVSERISRKNNKINIFTVITRVAATLTLPLLAFTIWSLFFQNTEVQTVVQQADEITWQQINSPLGMRSHIVLPDGTNLWLNAGSNIRYSIPFTGKTREIELEGEAFLDVYKNMHAPFIVNMGNTKIEVTGTQFNVKSYPGSKQIEVALKEGNINFLTHNIKRPVLLKPNDYLQFDKNKNSISLSNKDIKKYIAWHENIMILDDTPMPEVARLLEQWYGIKVIIGNEEILKYKFTTTFDNEPLFRVLELLELSSPISIKYSPGKPDKVTKKLSQSIVTITKKDAYEILTF